MPVPPIVVNADRRDNGQTLAAVLKAHLGLSWTQAKRVIDRRHVRVGGQIVADAAYRVKTGKRITVAGGVLDNRDATVKTATPRKAAKPSFVGPKTEKKPSGKAVPTAHAAKDNPKPRTKVTQSRPELEILFSDAAVVVVNKPAGLTTVRSAEDRMEFGEGQRYLPKTLAELLPAALGLPDKPVVAVHRLDRDTSGVLVFARNKAIAQKLMAQFRKHTTDRLYLALVRGEPKAGRIESVFVPDRGDGRRGSGTGEDGRTAVTYVKVIETLGSYALVECRLETGRTHQVRIHLGEAGTPLCGETVYDRPLHGQPLPDASGAQRPMLHAAKLGFTHPLTGERLNFDVPPPSDFANLLSKLRNSQ